MSINRVTDEQLPLGAGTGGADVQVVPAATTIVLRGDNPWEVLLMRRHERSGFVPGAWVFPGGAVDGVDRRIAKRIASDDRGLVLMKISALRELFEETGIWLGGPLEDTARLRRELLQSPHLFDELFERQPVDLEQLVLTSRWVTPVGVPRRFDTFFFLVQAFEGAEATPEENEGVEMLWITPDEALDRHRRGSLSMVFPTIKNLEAIAGHDSARALLRARRSARVEVTRPVLVIDGGQKKIILPEDDR